MCMKRNVLLLPVKHNWHGEQWLCLTKSTSSSINNKIHRNSRHSSHGQGNHWIWIIIKSISYRKTNLYWKLWGVPLWTHNHYKPNMKTFEEEYGSYIKKHFGLRKTSLKFARTEYDLLTAMLKINEDKTKVINIPPATCCLLKYLLRTYPVGVPQPIPGSVWHKAGTHPKCPYAVYTDSKSQNMSLPHCELIFCNVTLLALTGSASVFH